MLISKFGAVAEKGLQQHSPKVPDKALMSFLEKYNGGETPETRFSVGDVSSDIVAFYGVGNVKYSYDRVQSIKTIDDEFLPIAFDSFGNQIVVSLSSGSIGFVDHEKADTPRIIAQDFKTFIAHVRSDKINPKHIRSIEDRERDLIQRGKGNNISDALRSLWQKEIDKYSNLNQELVEL